MKNKNFVSAVVYVNNDEEKIKIFFEMISKVFNELFEHSEIIFVNDSASDNSINIIKNMKKSYDGNISIVNMSFKQGLEISMKAGMDAAIGDYVFEFDTINVDYNPSLVREVFEKALDNNDIVSAYCPKKSMVSSRLFYYIYNKFSHSQYKLQTETFRVLSRRAINRVYGASSTIPYRKALYANCGYNVAKIKYDSLNSEKCKRENGGVELASSSLIIFTNAVYYLTLFLVFLMILVVLATIAYTIVTYVKGIAITGWTTTMLFVSFGFLGVFLVLAFIVKYLSIILNLSFKKTEYVINPIEKISNDD